MEEISKEISATVRIVSMQIFQWNFDENHSVFVGGGYDFAGEVE